MCAATLSTAEGGCRGNHRHVRLVVNDALGGQGGDDHIQLLLVESLLGRMGRRVGCHGGSEKRLDVCLLGADTSATRPRRAARRNRGLSLNSMLVLEVPSEVGGPIGMCHAGRESVVVLMDTEEDASHRFTRVVVLCHKVGIDPAAPLPGWYRGPPAALRGAP